MKKRICNLLELKPAQNRASIELAEECCAILQPRFSNRFLMKWILPRMKEPNIRIKLDQVGTFVWKQCNGEMTVKEIAEKMSEHFGSTVEPAIDRLELFLKYLERYEFISYRNLRELIALESEPGA
jgi:hypothetical protein